jgi:hypothetical protein
MINTNAKSGGRHRRRLPRSRGLEQESSMNKILEGAKDAVRVAKCDHDLVVQPRLTANPALERFYCTKCQATIYEPIPAWRS